MKTPDEIKKGLACWTEHISCTFDYQTDCSKCPLNTDYIDWHEVMRDALAYIQYLEAENKAIKAANIILTAKATVTDAAIEAGAKAQNELEQVKRERDAAVKQVKEFGDCQCCKHDEICKDLFPDCRDCKNVQCPCNSCNGDTRNNWEWRGVPQEEA